MKKCPICNSENNDNADKCIICGNLFDNLGMNDSQSNQGEITQNNDFEYKPGNIENSVDNINNQNQFTNQQHNFQSNQQMTQNIPNQANNQFKNPAQFNNSNQFANPNQFNNPNQFGNQFGNPNVYQNNKPQNRKSKAVGIILNMILVGLGYAYVGKWGEGIVLLVVYLLLISIGIFLLFPLLIALILWIYSLFKTNEMIDKYNQGIPY